MTGDERHNDVIVEKVANIDQNSRSQTAIFSFQIVDRIRRQSALALGISFAKVRAPYGILTILGHTRHVLRWEYPLLE